MLKRALNAGLLHTWPFLAVDCVVSLTVLNGRGMKERGVSFSPGADYKVVVKAGGRGVCSTMTAKDDADPTWNKQCEVFKAADKSSVHFEFHEDKPFGNDVVEGTATYRLDAAVTVDSSVTSQKVVILVNPAMPSFAGKSFTFSYHMQCPTTRITTAAPPPDCDLADLMMAYRAVLCRVPDPKGAAYWLDECRRKTLNKHTITAAIRNSDEYRTCPHLDATGQCFDDCFTCGAGKYRSSAYTCAACDFVNCPIGQQRSGNCGGTTNGYRCSAIPNIVCVTNQYRVAANPGTCRACDRVVCPRGQQRSGTCGGTTNGFQCVDVPNIMCAANQYRVAANPGTCRACDRVVCPSGQQRSGSCSGTNNGYQCITMQNVVCGTGKYRVGASPGMCDACSNLNCAPGQERSGTCGGTTNGFQCTAAPTPAQTPAPTPTPTPATPTTTTRPATPVPPTTGASSAQGPQSLPPPLPPQTTQLSPAGNASGGAALAPTPDSPQPTDATTVHASAAGMLTTAAEASTAGAAAAPVSTTPLRPLAALEQEGAKDNATKAEVKAEDPSSSGSGGGTAVWVVAVCVVGACFAVALLGYVLNRTRRLRRRVVFAAEAPADVATQQTTDLFWNPMFTASVDTAADGAAAGTSEDGGDRGEKFVAGCADTGAGEFRTCRRPTPRRNDDDGAKTAAVRASGHGTSANAVYLVTGSSAFEQTTTHGAVYAVPMELDDGGGGGVGTEAPAYGAVADFQNQRATGAAAAARTTHVVDDVAYSTPAQLAGAQTVSAASVASGTARHPASALYDSLYSQEPVNERGPNANCAPFSAVDPAVYEPLPQMQTGAIAVGCVPFLPPPPLPLAHGHLLICAADVNVDRTASSLCCAAEHVHTRH